MCGGGNLLKTIAEIAAPIAGVALGPEVLGPLLGATGGSIAGGALGGGLGSEIGGQNPLVGAGLGGLGGAVSGLGGLEGFGNAAGGLFGAPTLGSDISGGISSGLQDVGSTLGNAFGFGGNPAYSDPSISGQFAQGLGSGSTTEFTPSGAGGSTGTLGAGFSPGTTGIGTGGGGTAGGFLQGLDTGSLAAGNNAGGFTSPTLGAVDNASASGALGGTGNVLSQTGAYDAFQGNQLLWQGADTAANAQTFANLSDPNFSTSALSSPITAQVSQGAFNPTGGTVADTSIGGGSGLSGILQSLLGGNGGGGGANMLNGLLRGGLSAAFNQNPYQGYPQIANTLNQSAQQYNPYIQQGQAANTAIGNLEGLNGQAAANSAQQNWQNTPGYQFQLQQGLGALQNSAAANGGLLSGNTMQALQNYGQGLANTTYNQYLGNLQNQAGQGLNAIGPQSQLQGEAGMFNQAPGMYKANNTNTGLSGLFGSLFPQQGLSLNPSVGGGFNLSQGGGGLLSMLGF